MWVMGNEKSFEELIFWQMATLSVHSTQNEKEEALLVSPRASNQGNYFFPLNDGHAWTWSEFQEGLRTQRE